MVTKAGTAGNKQSSERSVKKQSKEKSKQIIIEMSPQINGPLAIRGTQQSEQQIEPYTSRNQQTNISSKTRFIGKHSRDNRLSIFLNHRNSNVPNELLGLVRINRDALHLINEKGAVVIVGVMARLLCDHGLQFSEHFIYQKETPIYPQKAAVSCAEIELVDGVLGDAVLPDEFHRGFKLKLPNALPPSCIFLSPDTSMGPGITGDSPWGLTYYLYAYLSTQPHHRKSSKVFLSFTRALPTNTAELVKETTPPATTVTRSSNPLSLSVGSSKPLSLTAALDRVFFHTGEQMAVHVRIDNPRSINFTGVRITLKQIITTRALNQARQIIKVPLATYEFRYIDANGNFKRSPDPSGCNPKDFPFIIDTLRVNLKPGSNLQHVAVESLFPRNSIKSLILCPSFSQTYEMQDNPLKYFAIEYYMNVHVVLPWGSNLIAKLPFIVASKGVNEADTMNTVTIDNLASFNPQEEKTEIDDEPVEPGTLKQQQQRLEKSYPTAPVHVSVDYKIVKCDMERALKILEAIRQKRPVVPVGSFEKMRRTWTREYSEAFQEFSSGVDNLRNLLDIITNGTSSSGSKYVTGYTIELVRSIADRFVPLYNRFLPSHAEHAQVLEDALSQCLDTFELVLMKFHLLATEMGERDAQPIEAVEVNLDDLLEMLEDRLRKELDKLTLIIPGMVEWRWFLEELYYRKSSSEQEPPSPSSNQNNDLEMVKLFQSFHSRLTESFSDAQILPNEIFTYAQFCFSRPAMNIYAFDAHYYYFRQALLVYYGNYPETFLPFDKETPAGSKDDLKTMRTRLNELREKLIQTML